MLWIKFLICLLLIIISGSRLSIHADVITKNSRLSASLMGVLILAFITSCPELVTSLTSITAVKAPDLAAGDLLGADIFNVFVIALLGILCGGGTILAGQNKSNILSAVLTIAMLFVVIGFILLRSIFNLSLEIANISVGSILIALIYISGISIIFRTESNNNTGPDAKEGITRTLIAKFLISAVIIIISGIWLAHIGKEIADSYHWNQMYVGMLLLAFATTTPELVVSLTALKRNSIYMATGNLLGSNLFNIFIIFILDVFLRKGSFFAHISRLNILPATLAVILMVIAVGAMLRKRKKMVFAKHFSWDSIVIIAVFFAGHYLIFNIICALK